MRLAPESPTVSLRPASLPGADFGDFRVIGQGLILAAVVVFMPNGIVGLVEKLAGRPRSKQRPSRAAAEVSPR